MRQLFFTVCFAALLAACGGGSGTGAGAEAKSGAAANPAGSAAGSSVDTAKLRSDMDGLLNGMASGKMDTVAWQKVADDLGLTARQLLSEHGIDSSLRNSSDPAARSAAVQLKRLRDATGWTPDMMDSLKKADDLLKAR